MQQPAPHASRTAAAFSAFFFFELSFFSTRPAPPLNLNAPPTTFWYEDMPPGALRGTGRAPIRRPRGLCWACDAFPLCGCTPGAFCARAKRAARVYACGTHACALPGGLRARLTWRVGAWRAGCASLGTLQPCPRCSYDSAQSLVPPHRLNPRPRTRSAGCTLAGTACLCLGQRRPLARSRLAGGLAAWRDSKGSGDAPVRTGWWRRRIPRSAGC